METIMCILFFGAIIQSFLHSSYGAVHKYEKLFGGLYSLTFVALTVYSIIKYGMISLISLPAIFFGSNLLFSILFDKLLNRKVKSIKKNEYDYSDKINNKELLKIMINNINNENYSYEFKNGGYVYSSEITDIFKILNNAKFKKIYDDNISNFDIKAQKKLEKKDPLTFTLEECIIYFNYLWHLEGTGLASGIILKRIEDNRYMFTLGKLYNLID